MGAIDQPIQRERHTGFPIIPGSSMKGVFADEWNHTLESDEKGRKIRGKGEASWLFGSDSDKNPAAGALQFTEAKLLAFPVRSAKGCFAWLTCPLILKRAIRDGALPASTLAAIEQVSNLLGASVAQASSLSNFPPQTTDPDSIAILPQSNTITLQDKVVLEEYTFTQHASPVPAELINSIVSIIDDPLWKGEVAQRLVILSDGQLSYFARNACEVAQHVRIDDETGTAADGALFNQENVPSETLFYSVITCFAGRGETFKDKTTDAAASALREKLAKQTVLQFGGDGSTGLGYCSLELKEVQA